MLRRGTMQKNGVKLFLGLITGAYGIVLLAKINCTIIPNWILGLIFIASGYFLMISGKRR